VTGLEMANQTAAEICEGLDGIAFSVVASEEDEQVWMCQVREDRGDGVWMLTSSIAYDAKDLDCASKIDEAFGGFIPRTCEACGGRGFIPARFRKDGRRVIERCDACCVYSSDVAAAEAFTKLYAGVVVPPTLDGGPVFVSGDVMHDVLKGKASRPKVAVETIMDEEDVVEHAVRSLAVLIVRKLQDGVMDCEKYCEPGAERYGWMKAEVESLTRELIENYIGDRI